MARKKSIKEATFLYRFIQGLSRGTIYLVLIVWGIIAVIPFLWMISNSVMTLGEAINGEIITKYPLLQRFQMTDEELDVIISEQVPEYVREADTFTPSQLNMTAREYVDARETYILVGNTVYRGGLVNYIVAWEIAEFDEYVLNSVQITLITLSGELFLSIMAAYAFARVKWPGKNLIFGILISTMMIPGMVTMIPNFLTITWLGRTTNSIMGYVINGIKFIALLVLIFMMIRLIRSILRNFDEAILFVGRFKGRRGAAVINSLVGVFAFLLIFVAGLWAFLIGIQFVNQTIEPIPWLNNWPALTIPFMGSIFAIFLLRQFFSQIPDDLFDAAQIDGASHWQFLWSVAVPLSAAPILVITVLSFIGTWNALAWPLLVTNTPDWRPIAVGLYNFVDDQAGSAINLQMAGSVITIIPILFLYFLTQRQFTESIARTGLKG